MDAPSLLFWHGARRWQGPPEIRPARKGRREHGVGFYLTTAYATAAKYARGGGTVLLVEVAPDLTWADKVLIPYDGVARFLTERPGLRARAAILADVRTSVARLGRGGLYGNMLVNLMLYHEALTGSHGPALAAFLVAQGISAELVGQPGDEDWIVLYDLTKIRGVHRVQEARDPTLQRALPRVAGQGRAPDASWNALQAWLTGRRRPPRDPSTPG